MSDDNAKRISEYLNLDVDPNSKIYADLLSSSESEVHERGRVSLSDYRGPHPAGMTPKMLEWYNAKINPNRVEAIQNIESDFKHLNINGVPGFWPQAELDRIEAKRVQQSEDCILSFHEKHVKDLLDVTDSSQKFESLRAHHGREPIENDLLIYWAGLVFITICEMLLNFESLLRLPLFTPAFALGTALILALVIGSAGHIHGMILKQFSWYFGPEDKTRNFEGIRLALLGLFLLILGMVVVAWARFNYIQPKIAEALLTGLNPPSMVLSVIFMMTGNLIVYGLAVAWSYFRHDLDPYFPKAKKRHAKLRKKYDRVFRVDVENENERLRLKAQNEIETVKNRRNAIERAPGYELIQDEVASVLAQDQRVVAALSAYRGKLVDENQKAGKPLTFLLPVQKIEAGLRAESLDPAAYLAVPIRLPLAQG